MGEPGPGGGPGRALEDNLLTHNCGGVCVRAGRERWLPTLVTLPGQNAEAEREEQPPSTDQIREHVHAGRHGAIVTPSSGNHIPEQGVWAADSGIFGNLYVGDEAYMD
ncbi:hypothetical protein SAMN05444920_13818 [Nonomuraea solani]|uniref:Uncharacterized protein n=1 Tax=Nonomuraea solani TaxID=1144553 RepID=A0A1H6F384_9ACTN|nr:hypothetical protein [Nonomuraea solani]SEH03515.1 hypothetical protein SAMN05444920_13818 [Nonomuraea solani]